MDDFYAALLASADRLADGVRTDPALALIDHAATADALGMPGVAAIARSLIGPVLASATPDQRAAERATSDRRLRLRPTAFPRAGGH
jgi:hypothetical protein